MCFDRVFLIGPPASGKSRIGRSVALDMNMMFRTIDDWVPGIYKPELQAEPMSDEQVDLALSLLLTYPRERPEIVEFAHHDYVELLRSNRYPLFISSTKIIVTAPLPICLARNETRASHVRAQYLERAWLSTQSIIRLSRTGELGETIVLDTSILSPAVATAKATAFLNTLGGGDHACNQNK